MSSNSASSAEVLKAADVCTRLDVPPFVLKFWEGEFPQLGRLVGSKRMYGPDALRLATRLRELVIDQRRNLAEARVTLEAEFAGVAGAAPAEPEVVSSAGAASIQAAPADDGLRDRCEALEASLAAAQAECRQQEAELQRLRTASAEETARLERLLRDAEVKRQAAEQAQKAQLGEKGKELARLREEAERQRQKLQAVEARAHQLDQQLRRGPSPAEKAESERQAKAFADLQAELVAVRRSLGEERALRAEREKAAKANEAALVTRQRLLEDGIAVAHQESQRLATELEELERVLTADSWDETAPGGRAGDLPSKDRPCGAPDP